MSSEVLEMLVTQRESDKVATVGRMVETYVTGETRRIVQAARLTASRNSLGRDLRDPGGGEAIKAVVDSAIKASGYELIEVHDLEESLVYGGGKPGSGGKSDGWGVYEALQDASLLVGAEEGGVVVLRAIEPVHSSGKVVGTLSVGGRLDNALLVRIGDAVGANLALLSRSGTLLASTRTQFEFDMNAAQEAFAQKIPVFRYDRTSRTTRGYMPIILVDNAYVFVVEIDSAATYAQLQQANERATVNTLLILALSIAAGVLLMRRLMRPLVALRRRAEQLALDMTGQSIASAGKNEVGAVVEVLDALTGRLVARNAELELAREAAEAASVAKSQFLSNMSHEIRTPMNAILGMGSLMRHSGLTPAQSAQLARIESAGKHLLSVINNILDLSKIEAGKYTLRVEEFLVSELIDSLNAVIGDTIRSKGLDFRVDVSGLPTALAGDFGCLSQCLLNYLSNAVKFTDRGSITLRGVIEARGDGDALLVRFSVTDTGCGLSAEARGRVFEAFEQADNSSTRAHGGTGLGLTIVHRMAVLMGGHSGVDSEPGRGSTFWVTAWLHAAEATSLPEQAAFALADEEVLRTEFSASRILLVEDEPVNREIIRQMLAMAGISVDLAHDGQQAVEAVAGKQYDLILMDMLMPNMDGLEATRQIRALEQGRDVTIIALTANAFAEDREKCLAAGMNDYLSKPVTGERLYQRIVNWLRKTRHGPSAPAG